MDSEDPEEIVEIPTEDDGTLLLSSVSAQFPNAVGLRYKTKSGSWRGMRVEGNNIDPPDEGWGDGDYSVVNKKIPHNCFESGSFPKQHSRINDNGITDLMVGGLPFSASEDDIRRYFENNFGELDMLEVKYDNEGKSRGFGFIRFKSTKATEAALAGIHILNNRKFEVRYSKKSLMRQTELENIPLKLFVGRLPQGTTTTDLQEYFGSYGVLKDVYIPTPFKGYGFVQFGSPIVATKVLNDTHLYKGVYLNVNTPNNRSSKGILAGTPVGKNDQVNFLQNIANMATEMIKCGGLNNWMQNGPGFTYGVQNGNYEYDQVHKKKDKYDKGWKKGHKSQANS